MKKLSVITGILFFMVVLLAALGAVCGAVDQMATDENFYSGMSRAAVAKYLNAENDPQADALVTEYVGLSEAEQAVFAKDAAAFMAGEMNALRADVLSEKEQQHMLDVRALTQSAGKMSRTYLYIAAALAVAASWTGAKLGKRRHLPKLAGVLLAVSVIMLLVSSVTSELGTLGFETMFIEMHEALFQNDLWLMNPETDILIRMMPQPLFEQALLNGASLALRLMAVSVLMIGALHIVIENMIRRHVIKK